MKLLRLRVLISFVVSCCIVFPLFAPAATGGQTGSDFGVSNQWDSFSLSQQKRDGSASSTSSASSEPSGSKDSSQLLSSPSAASEEDAVSTDSLAEQKTTTVPAQLHGVAVSKTVATYVNNAEPQAIKLPIVKDTAGDLAKKIEAAKKPKEEAVFEGLIKEIQAEKRSSLSFKDIPFISLIPLPKTVKAFFDKIVMYLPVVSITKKGFSVDGMIDIDKVRVWGRIMIDSDSTGKKRHSLALELPKGWKFSTLFPKTEKFDPGVLDLFVFERAYLVLSSAKYKDPMLKKDISVGLNFLAGIRPVGEFFEGLNELTGGVLKSIASIDMQGVIGLNEQLVGTLLEFELPVGLKFTSWLSTSNLKFFIALEERISQVVRPTVGISGGLHVLLPFQTNKVEFRLTGKYALPEDLELYGEMNGWLDNVPYPHMKVGDLRLGIITDIAAAVASGGVLTVSGINVAGGVGVMDSKMHLALKGALDATTGIDDMTVVAKGTLTLKDLVWFWVQSVEDIAKLFKKDESFVQGVINKVPPLEFKDVNVVFVPKETVEEKKRIEVSVGSVNIFGLQGSGILYLDKQGMRGKLNVPEITIGSKDKPLFYLSGVGENGKKGLVFDTTINLLEQSIFADVEWGSSLLGMKYYGRANITAKSLEVIGSFKWSNLVDTQIMVKADLLTDKASFENFSAHMKLQQSGQEKFAAILKAAAQELLGGLQKKLDKAREKGIDFLEGGLTKKEEQILISIDQLEKKIKEKKDVCDKTYAGSRVGLRPFCYVGKGVVGDTVKLIAKKLQRDIELNVRMVSGVMYVETVANTAQAVTRPIGAVMSFLADVLANAVVIRQFDAQASFKKLAEKQPVLLTILDMRLAGKDFLVKDLPFQINKPQEFLMDLFDQLQKQVQVPVAK